VFNINGPLLVANVVVTGIMLWGMAVASMPWAVGIVVRSLIEQGLLLVSCVGVSDRVVNPRH
jgi:hypothetical protein